MQERQVCNDDNHDEVRIDGDGDVCLSAYNHVILAIAHLFDMYLYVSFYRTSEKRGVFTIQLGINWVQFRFCVLNSLPIFK